MALGIAVTLVGTQQPQPALLSLSGLSASPTASYSVTGTSLGDTWFVRGGNSFAPGASTYVLADCFGPVNQPVTYILTDNISASAVSSSAVHFPYTPGSYVFTSVDGSVAVPVQGVQSTLTREIGMRSTTFAIPGRSDPVIRYDVPSGETGTWAVFATKAQSDQLRDLLAMGGLVLLRTDGGTFDIAPAEYALITSASGDLAGLSSNRVWTLAYAATGDPEPTTVLVVVAWTDFNTSYAAKTWTQFNAEWAGGTWSQFNATDWTTH